MSADLKIVLIGAASPQWGFTLMRDIDEVNLEKAHRLAEMVAARTGERIRIQSTTNQRDAIADADFVVTGLAVGSLEAMQADLEIFYLYGIYQPVGDTVSIGGAIRTARNIPALLSIARRGSPLQESESRSDCGRQSAARRPGSSLTSPCARPNTISFWSFSRMTVPP